MSRRAFGAAGNEGIGANDGLRTHLGTIENSAIHADQAFVANGAGVDYRAVADRHPATNNARIFFRQMNDRAILDI